MKKFSDFYSNKQYDVHCHLFNYKHVPNEYIYRLGLDWKSRSLRKISKFLKNLNPFSKEDIFSDLGDFVDGFRRETQQGILNTHPLYNYGYVVCPLSLNMSFALHGKVIENFESQADELANLAENNNNVLPFLGDDPRNPKFLDNFEKYVLNGPFQGLKIYPALGYKPSHPNLMKVFEKCEELGIPITCHGSSGGIATTYNKFLVTYIDESGKQINEVYNNNGIEDYFSHPNNWLPVLKFYPRLKLNLAHFGGRNPAWTDVVAKMMCDYQNVYSDISFSFAQKTADFSSYMEKYPKVFNKLMFGSDYYIVELKGHLVDSLNSYVETKLTKEQWIALNQENPKKFLF